MVIHAEVRRTSSMWVALLAVALLLVGCGSPSEDEESGGGSTGTQLGSVNLDMAFPDSMTGGKGGGTGSSGTVALHGFRTMADGDEPDCDYLGAGDEDPFQNGYRMTQFLVGASATWMCLADFVVNNVGSFGLPEGVYVALQPETADDPTGVRIDVAGSVNSVELWWGSEAPPDVPGLWIAWTGSGSEAEGRLIVDIAQIADDWTSDDPTDMRMDFEVAGTQQTSDMFIHFAQNDTVRGFRIHAQKDGDAGEGAPVYTARGLLDMAAQFDEGYAAWGVGVHDFPSLAMYTVADAAGEGAASAVFQGVGLSLNLEALIEGASAGNHMGYYHYEKTDLYFFQAGLLAAADWVSKEISAATYEGGRTTDESSIPKLSDIQSELGLPADYFQPNEPCSAENTDCQVFLTTVHDHENGWAGQEPDSGSDPGDWRSTIIGDGSALDYLTSIWPDDVTTGDWTDVFLRTFSP